jgi:zinc transport system substrate-binding protein
MKLGALLLALLVLTGCGSAGTASDGRPSVVTAFYPLQFASGFIGGGAVSVTDLTKPGAEPHDLELNPRQVAQISDAALVVYLKGFQPAVDEAVAQQAEGKAFDAGSAVPLMNVAHEDDEHVPGEEQHSEAAGGKDPHVWLDPVRLATIGDRLGERLAGADPEHAAGYLARAAALHAELAGLDTEYATRLKTCDRRDFVTSHTAFGYLAQRYNLREVGITGISPEAEPTPQRLAEVAQRSKETGTTTIFFETLVSPKVADTIAREVGARTAVLDPVEGRTDPDTDYFSIMRANLTALTTALGCKS